MKTLRFLILVLLTAATSVMAQTNLSGMQNIPRQGTPQWKHYSSEHFDVHYSTSDPGLATLATRYAQDALWDITHLFDYNNRGRFAIYLFQNADDLARSNMYPYDTPKSGGVTPIRTNTAPVLFPGNQRDFQRRIRAEVARLLIEDFYFGGGIQASIQNTVLLHLPQWFSEGLPAYLGEGWDYTDELWLASLEHTNMLDFALDGNGHINHIARKSIWYFIASQYGKEKLAEIFYMTRLTRSAEDGIVHVLGITLKTLTERWREFVLQRITENNAYREPLAEQATRMRLGAHGRLLNFALNPSGKDLALQVERDGFHEVLLYDISTKTLTKTPIRQGWKTNQFRPFLYELPMTWSPDGKQLLAVTLSQDGQQLALWNKDTDALNYISFQPRLERILSAAWSHDGRRIVVSGLRQGTIDLYLTTPGSNTFQQITEDVYDDLQPIWSMDDERIYFASSRPSDTVDPTQARFDANNVQGLDLYELSIEGGALRQVSHSPVVEEFPVRMMSSFEMLVRTNQSGIWNLERRNVFLGDSIPQSNITQGIYQVEGTDSLLLFTVPEQGRLVLYQAPTQTFLHDVVSLKSFLRMREDKAAMAATRASQQQALRDSVARAQREKELEAQKAKPDTNATAKGPTKYYVFDEESEAQKPRRTVTRNRATILRKEAPQKPDFQNANIGSPSASKTEWVADRVTTRLGFDPVFKLSMLFEARLRDQQGNHAISVGFQPYIDLKSADAYVRYQKNKHKLDYFAGFTRSTRFLNRFDYAVRSNSTRLDAGIILPITRFLSVSGGVHTVYLDRRNLEIRIPKEIDGHELLAGARIDLTYDRTKRNGLFVQQGTFATLGVQDVASIKERYNRFATFNFDLRKYIPVQHFVLATRLTGSWSAGRIPQKFFVGGTEDWLFSQFENPDDYPMQTAIADFHYMGYATPLRGFRFNARNGSRYLVANAELRIPVARLFKSSLNSNPLYNFELIPFFDLGTAWSSGNPFSQRNPIDTETIDSYPLTITVQTLKSPFIMGFGAGTRLQVFGYSTRVDLGWGIDDYTLQRPRIHLSLGKNF